MVEENCVYKIATLLGEPEKTLKTEGVPDNINFLSFLPYKVGTSCCISSYTR